MSYSEDFTSDLKTFGQISKALCACYERDKAVAKTEDEIWEMHDFEPGGLKTPFLLYINEPSVNAVLDTLDNDDCANDIGFYMKSEYAHAIVDEFRDFDFFPRDHTHLLRVFCLYGTALGM